MCLNTSDKNFIFYTWQQFLFRFIRNHFDPRESSETMDICYALKSDCFIPVRETFVLVGGKQVSQRRELVEETSKNDSSVSFSIFLFPDLTPHFNSRVIITEQQGWLEPHFKSKQTESLGVVTSCKHSDESNFAKNAPGSSTNDKLLTF